MKFKLFYENYDDTHIGDLLIESEIPWHLKGEFIPIVTQKTKEFLKHLEAANYEENEKNKSGITFNIITKKAIYHSMG